MENPRYKISGNDRPSRYPADVKCFRACVGQDTQPCWGHRYVVEELAVGEDCIWIYACEGHADVWDGEPYRAPADRAA